MKCMNYKESEDGSVESQCCGNCKSYHAKEDEYGTPCSFCFKYEEWVCVTNGTCNSFERKQR